MEKILNIAIVGKIDENGLPKIKPVYFTPFSDLGASYTTFSYTTDEKTIANALEKCDGILFTGGVDVHPKRYNEHILNATVSIDEKRDEMEFAFIVQALKSSKPILAICRGVQLLCVAMGGTLYQDLPTQKPSFIAHKQIEGRTKHSHFVNVEKASPLFDLLKSERVRVNSFHHQAIKTLGKNLAVMALADDEIIEAIYSTESRYIRAYQWHPERLIETETTNIELFRDFVNACRLN